MSESERGGPAPHGAPLTLWAVVPVKPFAEAKQRLGARFDDAGRIRLSRFMLDRTLSLLAQVEGIARRVVVSRDPEVLALAGAHGARPIPETAQGLNEALEQATQAALSAGVQALLIVPIDLLRLTAGDIRQIIRLGQRGPCVVLAPALRDEGTNALLVNPPGLIRYAFGERSFIEHQRRAERAGARVEVYRSDTIAVDIDRPEDLGELDISSIPFVGP